MKTKLVILFTLLGPTACTTLAVKMSPEEKQSLFAVNTDLAQAQIEGVYDSRQHFKSGQLKIYTYVSSGAKTVVVDDYSVLL